MHITFVPLAESHFLLLLKWLETAHVKAWWDQDIQWTPELIQEKYGDYIKGYKLVNGVPKSIKAYIICIDEKPIGYIQIYHARDFPRIEVLDGLPEKLAVIDVLIGEADYLKQGIGSKAMTEFLNQYATSYTHVLVDPDRNNVTAIRAYEKAGFKKIPYQPSSNEIWLIRDQDHETILQELKAREPIFHHPDKFGKTKQDIENQMCDEFFEVGASGTLYTKQDVVETLLERYNDPNYQDTCETFDFELTEIAKNNYLLTYNLMQYKTRRTRRSTIWRNENKQWKILYHQGTVVSE